MKLNTMILPYKNKIKEVNRGRVEIVGEPRKVVCMVEWTENKKVVGLDLDVKNGQIYIVHKNKIKMTEQFTKDYRKAYMKLLSK